MLDQKDLLLLKLLQENSRISASEVGEKLNHDKKDIRISIEKNIDDTGEEIVNVVATGSGSVTKEDIEKELEKLYAEKNIDISSGNVNIEINVEETK